MALEKTWAIHHLLTATTPEYVAATAITKDVVSASTIDYVIAVGAGHGIMASRTYPPDHDPMAGPGVITRQGADPPGLVLTDNRPRAHKSPV